MLEKSGRVRAVCSRAILRERTCSLRIGHQRVRWQGPLVDLTVSTAHSAGGKRAPHRPDERIVAAGIENDEPQVLHPLQYLVDAIERYRLVLDIDVSFEHRV